MNDMSASSRIESVTQRFSPYIQELRDFFRDRKVPFGQPADLQDFPNYLANPAFAEEMVSMVRSILYREDQALPRNELLELVAVAVGGPGIEDAPDGLQEPLREVLLFVTDVIRGQRTNFPQELPEEDELSPPSPPSGIAESAASAGFAPEPRMTALPTTAPAAPDLFAPAAATPAMDAQVAPEQQHINGRLSQLLAESERADTKADIRFEPVVPPRPAPSVAARPAVAPAGSRRWVTYLRGAYWIPGLCLLLLALGLIYFLRPHPAAVATTAAATTQPVPPLSRAAPKPTAYGADRGAGAAGEPAKEPPEPVTAPVAEATPAASLRDRAPRETALTPHRTLMRPGTVPASITLPGAREGVFLASSGMMAAHLLSAPAPGYPKLASFARVEGEVIVQVVVSREGKVEATRVLQGPRLLRSAAEHAIRRWRYRPYVVDGKPTDVATIVTVTFRLKH